ncbi:MAG: hypothetical protein IJ751_07815 [Oscillospiraceae bacterium]|nr:hypothetical protein [Oscillospiraceae bacterium]
METTIKSKRVSYGLVELKDAGASSPRYRIYVNGQLKEYSNDLNFMVSTFERKYY